MKSSSWLITLSAMLHCSNHVAGYQLPSAAISQQRHILQSSEQAALSTPSALSTMPDCELRVLTMLGWQTAYNAGGYSIMAELPTNCTSDVWQSLGCLKHVTNITLTGSLPDLPDSWAANESFPVLEVMNFSTSSLAGSLPPAWASTTAFPDLKVLDFSSTQLSGTLPVTWGQPAVFGALAELHLAQVSITGRSMQSCLQEHISAILRGWLCVLPLWPILPCLRL